MKDTAILISSCDKYSFCWKAYEQIFQKYWPDCPFPIHFVTGEKQAPFGRTLNVAKEDLSWSAATACALMCTPYDNIIFLLEDYWFTKKVNNDLIYIYLESMDRFDAKHLRLYSSIGSKKIERKQISLFLDILNPEEPYRASLNAGIWDRKTFLNLLDMKKSIWESELSMSDKSKDMDFLTVRSMEALEYDVDHNMIEQGKITKEGYEYLERERISLT